MKSIEKYETICTEIVLEFAKKQNLIFEDWIGEIGEICVFNQDEYYFNFNDVCFDLKSKQPKGQITDWQDFIVDLSQNNKPTINYRSYCKGLRF